MNKIILGSCIDEIKSIDDCSIQTVFADPPFNLSKGYDSTNDSMSCKEYLEFTESWLTECVRVLAPSGSLFVHNLNRHLFKTAPIIDNLNMKFKSFINWCPVPHHNDADPMRASSAGILYYCKNSALNYSNNVSVFNGKKLVVCTDSWSDIQRVKHGRVNHPCQLPVELIERIILLSTKCGDTVLDPFCGSGTTPIAAKRLGRKYISFDVSSNYVDIAKSRLSTTIETCIAGNNASIKGRKIITISTDLVDLLSDNFSGNTLKYDIKQ